jgi:hypothetical protein
MYFVIKCPLCSVRMERGCIMDGGEGLLWDNSKRIINRKIPKGETVVGFTTSYNRLRAYRCKECKIITFEY